MGINRLATLGIIAALQHTGFKLAVSSKEEPAAEPKPLPPSTETRQQRRFRERQARKKGD